MVLNAKNVGIGIGAFLTISYLFLLVSTDLVFGSFASQVSQTLVVYGLLLAVTLSSFGIDKLPLLNAGPTELLTALIAFMVSIFAVTLLPQATVGSLSPLGIVSVIGGFLFGGIKSFIEEVVFRGTLMSKIGNTGQSVLFGLFHLGILSGLYGLSGIALWIPVISLSILGFIWGLLRQRTGNLAASWGSHWGYNAGILEGVRAAIIGF